MTGTPEGSPAVTSDSRLGDMEFWSEDRRFGLRVNAELLAQLREWCAAAGRHETGGILVGHYTGSLDCAIATHVSGAPADSRHGPNWFHRGVSGLQPWLDRLWQGLRHHYLGEWHYHPGHSSVPSSTDDAQMVRIAGSRLYRRPEPVSLVIGGSADGGWSEGAYVYPRRKGRVTLVRCDEAAGP